jgi:hypothetical protein
MIPWLIGLLALTLVYLWIRITAKPISANTLPILPPNPIPKFICPACGSEYNDGGHCKCPQINLAMLDAAMQAERMKPVKVKKYRSIDDDWRSE